MQKRLMKLKATRIMKVVEEEHQGIVNSFWRIIVLDIETTLSRVCQAVLNDPTATKDELKQRAIGMKMLGTILQGAKKQEGA
ncbi:hypothetical protein L2E82_37129 [Cichorium intybus]|uniref:Uncharacterized protein n=1 Tax=Cichorium intybus TaxID=13427 RepID=A0ACB9AI25_CICIN|nr:hypothetical protein L2E82_37129 [Cichorium intybus]